MIPKRHKPGDLIGYDPTGADLQVALIVALGPTHPVPKRKGDTPTATKTKKLLSETGGTRAREEQPTRGNNTHPRGHHPAGKEPPNHPHGKG